MWSIISIVFTTEAECPNRFSVKFAKGSQSSVTELNFEIMNGYKVEDNCLRLPPEIEGFF